MHATQPVLVIGAAGIDIKSRPYAALQMGQSNPGVVRNSVGGVARNIAENLARLEVPTVLLTAVGEDHSGDYVVQHIARAGVDTSYVLHVPDRHTGSYVSVQDEDGSLIVAISEYDIVEAITPAYLQKHRALFAEAALAVVDANLSPRALNSVFRWAERYNVPVCADPTSQKLAPKLLPHLHQMYMVAPDAHEAAVLCERPHPPATSEEAIEAAQCLVGRGVQIAIVTLGAQGLAYAAGNEAGHIPALRTPVVDKTGVGDALTAAVIFGLLNEFPLDEAVRLGVAAAALTLRTGETVAPDLSLDRLYDDLVV